jgi:hypothetical protein
VELSERKEVIAGMREQDTRADRSRQRRGIALTPPPATMMFLIDRYASAGSKPGSL